MSRNTSKPAYLDGRSAQSITIAVVALTYSINETCAITARLEDENCVIRVLAQPSTKDQASLTAADNDEVVGILDFGHYAALAHSMWTGEHTTGACE
jgi:hypothetical protein